MTVQPLTGAITPEERAFVEEWQKIAVDQYDIIRYDVRGEEKHELITPKGRKFFITTAERIITEDRILHDEDNPFRNGAFRPITVPESVTIESNPNALSDEEISNVLTSSDMAFDEWLKTIDSAATLRRMMELAEEQEVSLKRYRSVESRLVQVQPQARIVSKDSHLRQFLDEGQRNETGENPRRTLGGRSADYRSNDRA